MKRAVLFMILMVPCYFSIAQDSALHLAAAEGNLVRVRQLLGQGSEPDSLMSGGWTPLMISSKYGHTQVMQALVRAGANVNASNDDGNTPLIVAVSSGKAAAVRVLLNLRADVNHRNAKTMTALDIARLLENREILTLLENYQN